MKRVYCSDCAKFEFRQAEHPEWSAPRRRSSGDWAWALITWGFVLGLYFLVLALAWAYPRVAEALGGITFGLIVVAGLTALIVREVDRA